MRKRNVKKQFWLYESEAKALRDKSERVKINESHLIRMLLEGYHPAEAPPDKFYDDLNRLLDAAEKFYTLAEKTRDPGMKEILKTAYEDLRGLRTEILKKYISVEKVSVDFR